MVLERKGKHHDANCPRCCAVGYGMCGNRGIFAGKQGVFGLHTLIFTRSRINISLLSWDFHNVILNEAVKKAVVEAVQ